MAVGTQMGAPSPEKLVLGTETLGRFHRCEASVAAPVTPVNFTGLQDWNIDAPTIGYSKELFQQGGGQESTMVDRRRRWSGTLSFLKGDSWTQMAAMLGITFASASEAMMPMYKENDYPDFVFEGIIRQSDNTTHYASVVIPDITLGDVAWSHPIDDALVVIPFTTKRFPFWIPSGTEIVLDKFTGTGSTTEFTLSATPLTWTSSYYHLSTYDSFIYVKEKASGDSTGTIMTTGYSNVTTTLTAATAPAASAEVSVLYIKETS